MKVILLALSLLGCSLAMPVGVDEGDNPRPVVPLVITDYSSVASKSAESTAAPSSEATATYPQTSPKDDATPQPTEASTELAPPSTENDALRSVEIPTPNLQETVKADAAPAAAKEMAKVTAESSGVKPEEAKEALKTEPLAVDVAASQENKEATMPQDAILAKQASENTEVRKDAPAEENKPAEVPIKSEEKELKSADNIEPTLSAAEKPADAPKEKIDMEIDAEKDKIKDDSISEESKESLANPVLNTEAQPAEPQQEKKIETAEEIKEPATEIKEEEKKHDDKPASRRRRHVKEDNKPMEENKKPTNAPKKEKEEKKGKSEGATKINEDAVSVESPAATKTEQPEKINSEPTIAQDLPADINQKDIKDKLNSEEKDISEETSKQTMETMKTENKREAVPAEENAAEVRKDTLPKLDEIKETQEKAIGAVDTPKEEPKIEEPKKEEPKVEESINEKHKMEEPIKEEPKKEEPMGESKKEEPKDEEPKKEEPKTAQPTALSDTGSEPPKEIPAIEKKAEYSGTILEDSIDKEDSPVAGASLSASDEKNLDLKADSKSEESA